MQKRMSFVWKRDSWVMRVVGWFLRITGLNPLFMDRFWTTIGSTIYLPSSVIDPEEDRYRHVRQHELLHVDQFKRYGLFVMAVAYMVFPLPFFLSGRWWIERTPFLYDIRAGVRTVESAVLTLHHLYGRPWPRKWMERWFMKELSR